MMIKLFDLGNDWYAAETLEEAVAAFHKDMINNLNYADAQEIEDEYPPENYFEESNLDGLRYQHEDGRQLTFAERLKEMVGEGAAFPCCFASRDW